MKRQKTLVVNDEKIRIVSTLCVGLTVRTVINGVKYFSNFEIMKDYKITDNNHSEVSEEFIKRAMEKAYVKWVKSR